MIEVVNPQDGDSYAGLDVTMDFENLSGNFLNLQYYGYQDFDLDPANFSQEQAHFDGASIRQQNVLGLVGREALVTPHSPFDHWEINQAATLFDQFTVASAPFDLSDGTNDLQTDIELAFQYNQSLAIGATETIQYSIDITPALAVPEPGLPGFFLVGMIAMVVRRRSRPPLKTS